MIDTWLRVDEHPNYNDTIIINGGDRDLMPIKLSIKDIYNRTFLQFGFKPPPLPKIRTVDNFNLEQNDQLFTLIHKTPPALISLERNIKKEIKHDGTLKHKSLNVKHNTVINRFWEQLEARKKDYIGEIEYIKKMWYFRLFGYWFFNNGIPTYMTGANFMYLYNYHLKSSSGRIFLPDYRDRDRRWFLFQQFTRNDTTTFANRDKDGWAIPNENGEYKMIDIGVRTCYGTITSKPRRVGDTSKVGSIQIDESTRSIESQFGNQAMDDTSAERIFLHYINRPFNKYPIFFKPLQTQMNPKSKLEFENDSSDNGLGSWIDFATTKHASAYDGTALRYYYSDEAGKVKHVSIKARHGTVKLCLSERDLIYGFTNYTTTVEEMDGTAADEFMELSKNSMYNQRMDNGQTKSGMYVCFFPAYDGHPKFLDKFGMSIIDTPTIEQALFSKQPTGAKQYIYNQRKIVKGVDLALKKRQDPCTYRECFYPDPKNQLFPNVEELQTRVADLKFDIDLYKVGYFKWENDRFGRVEWVDDRENGRFILSKNFNPAETNKIKIVDGIKHPANPNKYLGCADPFRLEKTDSSRMSNGGIVGYWLRDYDVDPEGTDMTDLKSDRVFLSYNQRPDTQDSFAEDCLMACIYCGMLMYPENNITVITDKFIEWEFQGYLLYDTDPLTGKVKNNPGFTSVGNKKIDMFNMGRDHLKVNAKRCRHYDVLEQALNLRGLEDLKNKDLLTAFLGVFLAKKSLYSKYLDEDFNVNTDTSTWVKSYYY